jgi:hypothetical protein
MSFFIDLSLPSASAGLNDSPTDVTTIGERMAHIQTRGIERFPYLIRGERVMLGQDLAELYDVKTKALVKAVQRNLRRLPDGMLQLS